MRMFRKLKTASVDCSGKLNSRELYNRYESTIVVTMLNQQSRGIELVYGWVLVGQHGLCGLMGRFHAVSINKTKGIGGLSSNLSTKWRGI